MTPRSGNIAKVMAENVEEIMRDSRDRAIDGGNGCCICVGSSFLTGPRKKMKTELNSKQHHRVTHFAWFSSQLFKTHSTGIPKNMKIMMSQKQEQNSSVLKSRRFESPRTAILVR